MQCLKVIMIGPHANTYCYQEFGHAGDCSLNPVQDNPTSYSDSVPVNYKKQLEASRMHYGMCLGCGRTSPVPGQRYCTSCSQSAISA